MFTEIRKVESSSFAFGFNFNPGFLDPRRKPTKLKKFKKFKGLKQLKGLKQFKRYLSDERGNVESALVLVPLLVLVLSTLQIGMGVLSRNVASNKTQSEVVQSGLISPDGRSPMAAMSSLGLTSAAGLTLSGGGTLYVGAKRVQLPSLTPLLPQGDSFTSVGVALGEGS